jgi:ArsR family transcriptional regulator, lead/cadmium/zinc/bismuth-responsive transcriptional repressor
MQHSTPVETTPFSSNFNWSAALKGGDDAGDVYRHGDPGRSRLSVMENEAQVRKAAAALADVDIAAWTRRFDLLSDPGRLEILLTLHRVPGIFVGDLAAALGRSENAVSQALRVLRQQGTVSSTRVGRAVSYRLEDADLHDLLHWIGAAHG